MLPAWRLQRMPTIVAEHHQLHVLETHVWTEPVRTTVRHRQSAFGRSGRLKRQRRREMGLADESRPHASVAQCATDPRFTDRRVEVNSVVVYPVGIRQKAGQNGRA